MPIGKRNCLTRIVFRNFYVPLDKFDVMQPKNKKFTIGIVIDTDVTKNRVKFHFPHIIKKRNTKVKEWIKVPSYRVAPLGQYTKSV